MRQCFKVTLNLNNGIIRDYTVYASSDLKAILQATKQAKHEGYSSVVLETWKVVK